MDVLGKVVRETVIGITPEGDSLTVKWTVPDGWFIYYCKYCSNPLGMLRPEGVKHFSFTLPNQKGAVTGDLPPIPKKFSVYCARCGRVTIVDINRIYHE